MRKHERRRAERCERDTSRGMTTEGGGGVGGREGMSGHQRAEAIWQIEQRNVPSELHSGRDLRVCGGGAKNHKIFIRSYYFPLDIFLELNVSFISFRSQTD